MANSIIFADPGGEYYFGLAMAGAVTAGVWSSQSASLISTGQVGRQAASDGKVYAILLNAGSDFVEHSFAANYSHLILQWAIYVPAATFTNNQVIAAFKDSTNTQTDIRTNSIGQPFFTRNGTAIGSASASSIVSGWNYFEWDTLFATSAIGTSTLWLNSVQVITATSVQTANTNAFANRFRLVNVMGTTGAHHVKDIVVIDPTVGALSAHIGDVTVKPLFANGAGANAQFADGVGSLTLTSVNTTGVYQGTITGGASNALVGKVFSVTGFVNGANNQTNAVCTASTATALTLGGTTISETHAGTAAYSPSGGAGMVNDGINHLGTWPDGNTTYISDSTAGHISDFAHEALSLTGTIYGVVHVSYVDKDDVGARAFRQVCVSGGTTETNGSDLAATNTKLYYYDYMDLDPNTSAAWSVSNYNSASFGCKEIT